MTDPSVTTLSALREIYQEPSGVVRHKEFERLDDFCRQFIARSPFVCIATTAADGTADCSPRGDPPGSVKVVDDQTVIIPDRKGNNRVDTHRITAARIRHGGHCTKLHASTRSCRIHSTDAQGPKKLETCRGRKGAGHCETVSGGNLTMCSCISEKILN